MIYKDFISEDFGEVVVETVNISRATLKEAEELRNRIRTLIEIGCKKIIIDLSYCDFCDSTFMGALVLCAKKSVNDDFHIGIVIRQGSYIEKLFETTGLKKVLKVFNNRSIAINQLEQTE